MEALCGSRWEEKGKSIDNGIHGRASQIALSFFESLSSKGQSVMSDSSRQYPLYRFWDRECRSSRPPAVPSPSLCCWDAQSSRLFLMEIAAGIGRRNSPRNF